MREVVVVAIVSYGRAEDDLACLCSLARSTVADFEIVIVENAGAAAFDGLSARLATALPWKGEEPGANGLADAERAGERCVRWHRFHLPGGQQVLAIEAAENLGYGGGINLALRCFVDKPGWRGIWILNPDTEIDPRALAVVSAYAERGGYGLVGCRLVFAGQDRVQLRGGWWRRLVARGKSIGYGEPIEAPVDVGAIERRLGWISGAALYATCDFVKAVGPMSEFFFLYCEDIDWALRRGRFRLGYAHDAIVRHAHGTTIGSAESLQARSNLSVYLTERNALLLTRKRFPALYPLVALITLVLLVDYLARGNLRVFAAACRGWWAGLRGETGRPSGRI